jgi:hypothetical protein
MRIRVRIRIHKPGFLFRNVPAMCILQHREHRNAILTATLVKFVRIVYLFQNLHAVSSVTDKYEKKNISLLHIFLHIIFKPCVRSPTVFTVLFGFVSMALSV